MGSPQLGQMRMDERHRRGAFTDRAANPRRRVARPRSASPAWPSGLGGDPSVQIGEEWLRC
jgi:hypothetical protein